MSEKKYYVYSTLTADNMYAVYVDQKDKANDLPQIERQILIRGGTNVADKRLITPRGVVTEVTADELAALRNEYNFNFHAEGGFLTWSEHKEDAEKVVVSEGLEGRDLSSPLVPEDFNPDAAGPKPTNLTSTADDAQVPAPHSAAPAHPAAAAAAQRRTRA